MAEKYKAPPTSQAPIVGPTRPDIAKAFAQFDVDGNGTLEKSELQRAFRAIGFKKVEVTDELFASFDPSGDGEITFRELYKMLRHNRASAAAYVRLVLAHDSEPRRTSQRDRPRLKALAGHGTLQRLPSLAGVRDVVLWPCGAPSLRPKSIGQILAHLASNGLHGGWQLRLLKEERGFRHRASGILAYSARGF